MKSHAEQRSRPYPFNAKIAMTAVVLFFAMLAVPFLSLPAGQVAYSQPNQEPTPPPGRLSLTVRAFVDFRCDRFFKAGADRPLASYTVMVTFANGATMTAVTSDAGFAFFSGFDVPETMTVSIDLSPPFRGRTLGPCPNSSDQVTLTADDFGFFKFKFVDFRTLFTGEVPGP